MLGIQQVRNVTAERLLREHVSLESGSLTLENYLVTLIIIRYNYNGDDFQCRSYNWGGGWSWGPVQLNSVKEQNKKKNVDKKRGKGRQYRLFYIIHLNP